MLFRSNWCYRDSTKYCAQYGRLYSWGAAMDSVTTGCGYGNTCTASAGRVQGVCPNGWHLPDSTEWETLFASIGGISTAGTMLKSTSGWNSNGNGTDTFGFSALPSGHRRDDGSVRYISNNAHFWSSSVNNRYRAYNMYLYGVASARLYNDDANSIDYGYAVRCLRD